MAKKQFKAESKRLMELMINSIYTHKEIFLREIISNASDAIDKLCYRSLADGNLGLSRSDFEINIKVDKDARTITVSDNGIGMTAEELDSNLGVIARSGSLGFKKELDPEKSEGIEIIGQFGVGFYSAFMVSEKVTVISKPFGSDKAAKWESSGVDGYMISPAEKEGFGTDIVMKIKEDSENENYSEFLDAFRLRSLIKKYSDFIRYPIKLDGETVNSMVPIWQRTRSELTDEDLNRFYRDKFYDMEDPVKSILISAEGLVSYKALLYIPKNAPYNFYTRDYRAGLQLYANGVMIMENCAELLPECFRFVRGVVDSPDLSLNISREMLQHDRQLKIIATNIEKKIKSELKKLLSDEREKYEEFYKGFGLQLKYGTVGDYGTKKDMLAELLMFRHASGEGLITLDEYTAAMPEEQKYIYYAVGESVAKLAALPQGETVRERGFDILYLTDDVDEFVMNVLGEYAGKEFKSINADDTGLSSEDEKKEAEQKQEENRGLLDFVKETLGDKIAEVKLTTKLKSHPVCLSSQGHITLEMEKYFSSLPGDFHNVKAQRVLEINGDHKTFEALKSAFNTDREKAAKYAQLLYFQALLLADQPVDDPARYTQLISELMV
ncbi:MAG TPA: molecular chaperone HtpG [Clostridiales bacterium]|nr:molecular chaperone HtpG [Clostridiales bacterium]